MESTNPTPEQIKQARKDAGLTQTEAAKLVGTTINGWKKWEAQEGSVNYRKISAATWELFLIKTKPARRKPGN